MYTNCLPIMCFRSDLDEQKYLREQILCMEMCDNWIQVIKK